jgi:hypothetical protein
MKTPSQGMNTLENLKTYKLLPTKKANTISTEMAKIIKKHTTKKPEQQN